MSASPRPDDERADAAPRASKPAALWWRLLRSAAVVYLAVLVIVYLFQRRLQYFPDPGPVDRPQGGERGSIEEVRLTASDGVALHAWHWPGTRARTMVFFHGNAGHRGHRLEWIELFHDLGYGVFIIDYRGYGGSGGAPTEQGLYRDGEAALDWLAARGLDDLVYVGESLGSGVAVAMAERRPPRALILHAGSSSIVDVGQAAYPFLPVRILQRDRYDSISKIGAVECPLLMVHGGRDEIIPERLGKKLFEAAREPKEWHSIANAGHNDLPWVEPRAYIARVADFLDRRLPDRP